MKKRRWAALLLAGTMIALAGCGGGAKAPAQEETKTAEKSEEADSGSEEAAGADQAEEAGGEERPYYVRDAEGVKGTLVVYNTLLESQQKALLELWAKYYPDCSLELQTDSIGTLATRIRSNESSDVDVVCGGFFATDGDSYQDILQPYTAACSEEQLFSDPDGYYTYFDVQLMSLIVNNAELEKLGIEINGYEDLLQPELKGKVILAAPDSTSSGYRHLQTILAVMGKEFADDESWDYVAKLADVAYSTTSSSDVYNLVQTGEYVAGLSYESAVQSLIADGADVTCVYMEEGNTAVAGGAGIVKNAPNQNAAEAMVDLLSSAEWQTTRDKVSQARASNGKADIFDLPKQDGLGLVDLDYAYLAENKASLLEKWNGLFAK